MPSPSWSPVPSWAREEVNDFSQWSGMLSLSRSWLRVLYAWARRTPTSTCPFPVKLMLFGWIFPLVVVRSSRSTTLKKGCEANDSWWLRTVLAWGQIDEPPF